MFMLGLCTFKSQIQDPELASVFKHRHFPAFFIHEALYHCLPFFYFQTRAVTSEMFLKGGLDFGGVVFFVCLLLLFCFCFLGVFEWGNLHTTF